MRIYRKEQRLLLRATFPPKPGTARTLAHQQWLALGVYANPEGLKYAEALAKTIGGQLARQVFDWTPYLSVAQQPLLARPLAEQLDAFEEYCLAQRSLTTFQSVYRPYLRYLLQASSQTPQQDLKSWIEQVLRERPVQSRGRQLACTCFKQLLTFLGQDPTFLQGYRGGYGQRQLVPRQLPEEEAIVAWFDTIPNPQWRLVYGLMATFGLRPHECFLADLAPLQAGAQTLWVGAETKTGVRETWPFYPEWVTYFRLNAGELPPVASETTAKALGARVNAQFRRYGIPFNPYLLRHAWAVRTIHFGLDSSIVAPMMGHSVQVHTGVYHHWLTRRDQQQAVTRALVSAPPAP